MEVLSSLDTTRERMVPFRVSAVAIATAVTVHHVRPAISDCS